MLLGIDHVVVACPDPEAAARELEDRVGLRSEGGGRHEAFGTFNRLVWLGDSYLELIGLFDRASAERSWIGAPTVRALDRGGGLATWAVATDDLDGDLARLRTDRSGLADARSGQRVRADGQVVRWRLAAPGSLGPDEAPFLIEHDPAAAEWTPADRAARAHAPHPLGGAVGLEILEIPVADPGAVGLRVLRTVGIGPFRPSLAGRGARDAAIGVQTIRYRRAGPTDRGLPTIHLIVGGGAVEPRQVDAVGCRFVLRSA